MDSGIPVDPAPSRPPGGLASFGVDAAAETLYRVVLRYSGESLDLLSDRTGVPAAALGDRLRPLVDLRLVRIGDGRVHAEPPDVALGRLVSDRARALRQEEERLAAVRAAIPDLIAVHGRAHGADRRPVPVEVIEPDDLVSAMESLVRHSTGELLFWRPDQFSVPTGQRMDEIVLEALRDGRRSRALYPSSIADDVPALVRARAQAGERVRVAPSVPSRMAVFGNHAVVVTEEWGSPVGHRLAVRQPAVVGALTALFEAYWHRAVSLPGLAGPVEDHPDPLVALLARGAKDEQMARVLGVSLRTARRRVAALMRDLGAESRFQAGMEVVRRGLV